MALYRSTRISLSFNDIKNFECWFLVDHQKMPSVSQLQQQINNRFYRRNVKGKIILTLKGSLIPSWESSLILRDDDQIVVQKENDNLEVRCFENKKRKKKLNSSLKDDSNIEIDTKANDIIFVSEDKSNFLDNSKKEYSTKTKNKAKKRKYLDIKEKEEEYLEEKERIEEHPEKKKKKEYSEKKEKEKAHLQKKLEKKEEHLEKKEHSVKKRKKEIEIYEEDSPLVIVEPKKKKKRKSEICDTPDVELDFENSSKELVEKDQKKHQKLHKLSKNQRTNCDQHKEIVIDDDDDEDNPYNQGSNSNLNKEIIIDDEEEENNDDANNSDNRNLENSNIKIPSVVSFCEIQNSQETLQNSDVCEKSKSSQNEMISLSTISPISTIHEEQNSNSFINSNKKNFTEVFDIPVKETIEVFGISNENLNAICKAVKDGESLTITENNATKIELCPNTIENVLNMDNIVKNEKLLINQVAAKNGSKPHRTRKHRKRRHGPSFACAPFIQAMSSHSEADTILLMSTPKTTRPQHLDSLCSSLNYSDKHIHFDSEDEAEGTASNTASAYGESEPNQCIPTSFNSLKTENCKIQSPNLENLVPETNKPQTNLDNSVLFSVRDALQKNCAVYQRGFGSIKLPQLSPSSVIVHPDKQQIETYSKNKQLRNTNQTHFNTSILKPNYDAFPSLSGTSCAGDRIAFKRLEIGIDYSPVISHYREATILAIEDETKMITLKFHNSRESKRTDGKFELYFEDEEERNTENETDDDIETVLFNTLLEAKLLSKS